MKALLVFVCLMLFQFSFSQKDFVNEEKFRQLNITLINQNQINKESKIELNNNTSVTGRYLGKIKAKNGKEYYVTTVANWYGNGISEHVNSYINIYNANKQFLGRYSLGNLSEIPQKIQGTKLYLKDSDCRETVIVNFKFGIPRFIDLKCNGQSDLIEFSN